MLSLRLRRAEKDFFRGTSVGVDFGAMRRGSVVDFDDAARSRSPADTSSLSTPSVSSAFPFSSSSAGEVGSALMLTDEDPTELERLIAVVDRCKVARLVELLDALALGKNGGVSASADDRLAVEGRRM